MSNRRWLAILAIVLLVLVAGIGIGAGAYHAGFVQGAVAHGARIVTDGPYRGKWAFGFFPFGFLLFPLFVILFIAVLGAAFGGRRRYLGWGGHGPWGPGPWSGAGGEASPRERMEAWHRQAHAAEGGASEEPGAGGAPSPGPADPTE